MDSNHPSSHVERMSSPLDAGPSIRRRYPDQDSNPELLVRSEA